MTDQIDWNIFKNIQLLNHEALQVADVRNANHRNSLCLDTQHQRENSK